MLSTGSFGSIAVSATRLPPLSTSAILAKAPAGIASSGHATSRNCAADSSLPKRSGFAATTIVRVLTGFLLASQASHALLGLAVEPGLRDEHRKQAEHDGERDHHDGACTHATVLDLTPQFLRSCRRQYRGALVWNW